MRTFTRKFLSSTLLSFLLVLLLTACDTSAERKEITAKAWQMMDNGALVIDVRTPEEYAKGHIEGAPNIPHEKIADLIQEIGPDKSREVVLYCRSGHRAGVAQEALAKAGYSNVFNGLGLRTLQSTRPTKN